MYKCQKCGAQVSKGTPEIKTITKTRTKVYKHKDREDSTGWEIVEEIRVCKSCAEG